MRWALTLQPHHFTVKSIKGKDNVGLTSSVDVQGSMVKKYRNMVPMLQMYNRDKLTITYV